MKRIALITAVCLIASVAPAVADTAAPARPSAPVADRLAAIPGTLVPIVVPPLPTIEELAARVADLGREVAELRALQEPQDDQAARLDRVERKAALDRLNLTGEIRVANDLLRGTQAAYFDGMAMQKGIVDSMFYMASNGGAFPMPTSASDPRSIYQTLESNVAAHYSDYLYFTSRLTFADLKGAMAQFPPAQQQALMQMLMPGTQRGEQEYDNNLLYTTRLRVNLRSEIAEHLSFSGRLAMYKVWGDSTGVQVFNGAPNSINVDGTTVGVPNSDIVRVDRAYFDWNSIGGSGLYLSLGRRPSTGGPPSQIREGRLRGGTPLGHVVDYQFDGITVGYAFGEAMPGAIWRFCYGLGYESGFGSGDQLRAPADRLKDAHFGGFNLDLYASDSMFVQATVLRAMDVPDGFNSLVVMPVDPLTGNAAPGPAVMRFTPSANLGDIDLAAIAVERTDGPVKWFASVSGMKTHPQNVTTPFGGLLSDPFSPPEPQDAWSVYTGLRVDMATTQIGAEFNHGSQYWFNFTHAADDMLISKLATRGNVVEVYLNQQLGRHASLRVSGINYDYDYSGSGWHMGAPKKLRDVPMLGFPTYEHMFNLRASMTVRF